MPESPSRERVFLSADWRDLVMLNYEVDPQLLQSYVPRGTELDSFDGKTFVSLVGFRFLRTRLFGALPIPFHSNFDEVNLRFYVRRRHPEGDRRGVVFIREIVPKRAIAYIARAVYGEKYSRFPMRHRISGGDDRKAAEYEWRMGREWCRLHAQAFDLAARLSRPDVLCREGGLLMPAEKDEGVAPEVALREQHPALPAEGSLEQFITEHYWGYSAQRNGGCLEYHVTHEPWRIWISTSAGFDGDATALYGLALADILRGTPHSAFIAEGSRVLVFTGKRIS